MKILVLLASLSILGACHRGLEKAAPIEDQVVYIGDNSKVFEIVTNLPYPKGLAYDSMAIQSEKEPYELKVFLSGETKQKDELEKAADQAFKDISNLGIISFYEKDSETLLNQYEK